MKARPPMSMTLRLALLLAGVAVTTFALIGGYLYASLACKMAHHDDHELIVRINVLRHFLEEVRDIREIEHGSKPFLGSIFNNEGCILVLSTADGAPLMRTGLSSAPLPVPAVVPAGRAAGVADIRDWAPAEGSGRTLSAIGRLGDAAGTPVRITIAREHSERTQLLRKYAWELLLAVCLGGLLVAASGFVVVRHGMRPLHVIIGKANDINTHHLNSRLAVDHVPAELHELGKAFNAMLARLEDGVQRLSGFAADLAHDLRTPIATLMVETEVALTRPRGADEYQDLLASNMEEYERLSQMIENTLFLARADNVQLALRRVTFDAATEFQRIHVYFEGLAEEAGVSLAVAPANARIDADPILFRRAVSNLVSNAIRYTPRGGAVRLTARETPRGAEVVVENSGPGIAPEHIAHIFDRYYRADPARAATSPSTGLGLAIVRAIMQLHGGEIQAHSVPNETTRFHLRFGR